MYLFLSHLTYQNVAIAVCVKGKFLFNGLLASGSSTICTKNLVNRENSQLILYLSSVTMFGEANVKKTMSVITQRKTVLYKCMYLRCISAL